MINPCKECIVRSMCQNECNDLIVYLQRSLVENYTKGAYKIIARYLRKNEAFLTDSDTDWNVI